MAATAISIAAKGSAQSQVGVQPARGAMAAKAAAVTRLDRG